MSLSGGFGELGFSDGPEEASGTERFQLKSPQYGLKSWNNNLSRTDRTGRHKAQCLQKVFDNVARPVVFPQCGLKYIRLSHARNVEPPQRLYDIACLRVSKQRFHLVLSAAKVLSFTF